MRTNRTLLVVAALAVTVLAAVGVAAAVSPTAQTDQPARQIEVGASGDVSAEPDQAIVRLGVVATADDAATARDRVAENVTAMRSTLDELGIPDDRIETAHYDIGEARDRPKSEQPGSYRAVHAFEVTLDETDRVGDVIDGVVDSGANRVQGVSFTLSDERRQDLRQEALQHAMEHARGEAETLAGSADLTIEGASSISASDTHVRPYRLEHTMTSGDAAVSTSIESGPVAVSASVNVVYNATSV